VSRFEGIVAAFFEFGEAAHAFVLSERSELPTPSGENLMGVALVTDIPNEFIRGGVKDIMQGNGQLYYPEAWRKMPAGTGDCLHDEIANILGEVPQLREGKVADISGRFYPSED